MKKQNTDELIAQIKQLLRQEERPGALRDERQARRQELQSLITPLKAEIEALENRLQGLPKLPDEKHMAWAQAILALPNACVIVLDTTGIDQHADILRVLLLDGKGKVLYEHIINPGRLRFPNTAYTQLTYQEIDQAPPLADVWADIQHALMGKIVLGYNLEFIQGRLYENANAYQLPQVTLIGEDLMRRSIEYFQQRGKHTQSLATTARKLGLTYTDPASALERASVQIDVLNAMARGVVEHVPAPVPVPCEEDELGDLDEDHPF